MKITNKQKVMIRVVKRRKKTKIAQNTKKNKSDWLGELKISESIEIEFNPKILVGKQLVKRLFV
jgi:hypothetical protein